MSNFKTAQQEWRQARLDSLRAEDGWLNLTDRVEFGPGSHTVGAGEHNDIRLSVGPDRLGVLTLSGDNLRFSDVAGRDLPFTHGPGHAPRLRIAGLLVEFTVLEGHHAIRVRDPDHPRRHAFEGLRWYPADPAWRIRAAWVALDDPLVQEIDTVAGITTSARITHKAVFDHAGTRVELLATHGSPERPMFVLRDMTSRDTTYPAARFLFGEDVAGDRITLDFNRAITPPCGFTEFATCPLPPPGNLLPFRIEAGEMRP